MARTPRSRRAPGMLEPGQVYHVVNRGVDRCDIFHSDMDRLVFLSMFAEACLHFGVVCHAWCLMTSHFHAVVEDTRGMLSQFLHRFESVYVRYFNDTRLGGRSGPLFEGRFRAELIDSVEYFEDACVYVVLNPMETSVPMAASADSYPWSSAAFVCDGSDAAESVARLLGPADGVDAVLGKLRPTKRKRSLELRRMRFEAFAGGQWQERDHVLAGRSGDEYRRMLAARVAVKAGNRGKSRVETIRLEASRLRAFPGAVASRPAFAGFDVKAVMGQIRTACELTIPEWDRSTGWLKDVVIYTLHRFMRGPETELAKLVGGDIGLVFDAVRRLGALRASQMGWYRLLWVLEWRLRWQLRAAPYRP